MNGEVSIELNTYRARLDLLMGVFGDNRILFGSDWPNSDGVAPADKIFTVAKEYFPGEAATDRREVFLEELGRRLQMDQARPITADGFEPVETESALQNYV